MRQRGLRGKRHLQRRMEQVSTPWGPVPVKVRLAVVSSGLLMSTSISTRAPTRYVSTWNRFSVSTSPSNSEMSRRAYSACVRECVTINRATTGRQQTRIGDGNLLMAYSHLGHNCQLGDRIVIANGVAVAGHRDFRRGAEDRPRRLGATPLVELDLGEDAVDHRAVPDGLLVLLGGEALQALLGDLLQDLVDPLGIAARLARAIARPGGGTAALVLVALAALGLVGVRLDVGEEFANGLSGHGVGLDPSGA